MAIFDSSNPTLSQKIFDKSIDLTNSETMTVRGSINKFGFLLFMVIGGAAYTWSLFGQGRFELMNTLMWVGLIGGMITGLVISFKPNWSPYLAPAYGILEGLMLGALSVIINEMFKVKYPGIIIQAVGITFGVAITMFALFNFRIIKATEKFKSIMMASMLGIAIFYVIYWILGMFGVNMSFMSWEDTSLLGWGINIFVAVIAALTLIMDFDRIEQGAATGAPKYMEWYSAFGLLVTLVWLYIQILKLLSRFASSRN